VKGAVAIAVYTQTDLDEDIDAITDSIESVVQRVGHIKANWTQVQSLHPGVSAVEYIRDHVPYLNKNTAAAVALVEAGTTSASDAARLTGRDHSTVSKAVKASVNSVTDTKPKPTTLATGATAPGPAIGSPKATKPVPAPRAVPALVINDEWDKVWSAMTLILSARDDHVISRINQLDDRERKAAANLMRSTAIRLNQLRKEVKP
jgi:hypothetical protein